LGLTPEALRARQQVLLSGRRNLCQKGWGCQHLTFVVPPSHSDD